MYKKGKSCKYKIKFCRIFLFERVRSLVQIFA